MLRRTWTAHVGYDAVDFFTPKHTNAPFTNTFLLASETSSQNSNLMRVQGSLADPGGRRPPPPTPRKGVRNLCHQTGTAQLRWLPCQLLGPSPLTGLSPWIRWRRRVEGQDDLIDTRNEEFHGEGEQYSARGRPCMMGQQEICHLLTKTRRTKKKNGKDS